MSSSSLSTRSASALRRRTVATVLVVVSLALLTVYFRESSGGGLHEIQSVGASILRPFEIAANRVAQPFEDASAWFGDLLDAKSQNAKLREENRRLQEQLVQYRAAVQQNAILRRQLRYRDGPSFPKNYQALSAAVVAQPSGAFDQQIVVDAGSDSGVRLHDPVVNDSGRLLGQVTQVVHAQAQITLLSDETSAVSACDLKTKACGIIRPGQSPGSSLIFDDVSKDAQVFPGDLVITSGWRSGKLASIYPRWIPIGTVTAVGQIDVEENKEIRVHPSADLGSPESVVILLRKGRR
jgi:rod shape-determining protein MreC